MSERPGKPSAFAPFRKRTFAILWTAALIANIGTWFRDVANGWTMTELAPDPAMVALVQAATTLPVFLFSLPAGALADLVDRRRLLLGIQVFLAATSVGLALAATLGLMTPWLLLGLVFAGGLATAFMGPAWQSMVPEIVPREDLRPAIALNSLGVNIARAIGPALGGLIVATSGAALAYWMDAASYLLILVALLCWKRAKLISALPPERFGPAMATGLRYVSASPDMRRTLFRAGMFFLFASAYWALLPLIARQTLEGDAGLYGVLLTSIGAGAVMGALLLPRLSAAVSGSAIVFAGTLATAGAMLTLATVRDPAAASAALFVAGAAWISVLTSVNVAAQTVLPNWVRARGLAIYIMVFFGSMTFGSLLWGLVAAEAGIPAALMVAAGASAAAGLAALRVKLPEGDARLMPSMHWPEPALAGEPDGDRGPVMIEITYRVEAENRAAFLLALKVFSAERRRDGGYRWQVFEDADDPELFVETFLVPSWLDHLRQHQRVTQEDADLQAKVMALHEGIHQPRIRHLILVKAKRTVW